MVTTTVKSEQERLEAIAAELRDARGLAATREVLGGDVRTVPGEDTGAFVPTYRTLLDARNHARILKSERLEARKAKEQALAAAPSWTARRGRRRTLRPARRAHRGRAQRPPSRSSAGCERVGAARTSARRA